MIAARELLETSIGQIRTLTAFLREQVGEGSDGVIRSLKARAKDATVS